MFNLIAIQMTINVTKMNDISRSLIQTSLLINLPCCDSILTKQVICTLSIKNVIKSKKIRTKPLHKVNQHKIKQQSRKHYKGNRKNNSH